MRDAIETKLKDIRAAAEAVNDAGWRGVFKSPATRAAADKALDRLGDKAERCLRVLRRRYGAKV